MRRAVPLLLVVLLALPLAPANARAPTADPADPARLVGGELLVDQFDADDFDHAFPGSLADQGPLALQQTVLGQENLVEGPNGFGKALEAGGASYARIDAPGPLGALSGDFTVMAWVRPHPYCGSHPILTAMLQNGAPLFSFYMNCNRLAFYQLGADGGGRTVDLSVAVPNDAWSHVAYVGTGDRVSFLLNGETIATSTRYPTFYGALPIVASYVGASPFCCYSSGVFVGALDEVRLYGQALTNEEVWDVATLPYEHPNGAPVADAGGDKAVACAGALTPVLLDAGASSDPDGDALSFQWSAPSAQPLANATSAQATAWLPVGRHVASLAVSDGELTGRASATITVLDATAPSLAVATSGAAVPLGRDVYVLGSGTFTATASDACSAVRSVRFAVDDGASFEATSAPYVFTYAPAGLGLQYRTLTVTATDAAGNAATTTLPLTVFATGPHAPSS